MNDFKDLHFEFIGTKDMKADLLTKAHPRDRHRKLTELLAVKEIGSRPCQREVGVLDEQVLKATESIKSHYLEEIANVVRDESFAQHVLSPILDVWRDE